MYVGMSTGSVLDSGLAIWNVFCLLAYELKLWSFNTFYHSLLMHTFYHGLHANVDCSLPRTWQLLAVKDLLTHPQNQQE